MISSPSDWMLSVLTNCTLDSAEYEFASKDAPNRSNLFKYIFDVSEPDCASL